MTFVVSDHFILVVSGPRRWRDADMPPPKHKNQQNTNHTCTHHRTRAHKEASADEQWLYVFKFNMRMQVLPREHRF